MAILVWNDKTGKYEEWSPEQIRTAFELDEEKDEQEPEEDE